MIYMDSCVLLKRYVRERGSESTEARFQCGEKILTSILSYAEVHSALARKMRAKEIRLSDFVRARRLFDEDWIFSLDVVELSTITMSGLRVLVRRYSLKGSDAVHLAAALWLRDMSDLGGPDSPYPGELIFATSDRELATAANKNHLQVFNPEISNHMT